MKHQSLPGFDLRPVCPVCKRPANILGQYEGYHHAMICRDCSLAMALPAALWEPHPRKPGEYRIRR